MDELIGKNTDEIERKSDFCWYVEFKPKEIFGFDREEHNRLMEVLIEFLPKENIRILKLNGGVVDDIFELSYLEVLENIKLLKDGEGKLYDEEDGISYSILTNDSFAIVQQGMVFWSSRRDLAEKWCESLKNADLNFHDMSFIGGGEDKIRKTIDKELYGMSKEELGNVIKEGNENSLWEGRTKINGFWVNDGTGELN